MLMSWTPQKGDKYVITGITITGQRFRRIHDNWFYARNINLWRGSYWLLRDGKRKLINRVFN